MSQLLGFIDPYNPHYVCLLHKTLYGLKQAPHTWFHRLTHKLLDLNFTPSKSNTSLFIHTTPLFLLVYVDDILVTCFSQYFLPSFISDLNATFSLKDLCSLHYFLAIKDTFTPNSLSLTQTMYTKDLLT